MEWYHYLAGFFAGAFLGNFAPHFVHGVSGNKFPSPFAKPPGKGLSSPLVNTLWGLLNLLIGCGLLRAGRLSTENGLSLAVFFIGIAAISIPLSIHFQRKDKE